MDATSNETLITSNESKSMFTYEFPAVDSDLSIFSVLEGETLGVEHFLEDECNKSFTDSALDFNVFNSQNCFNIENFSFAVEYDQIKIETDSMHSDLTQEEENKPEVCDAKFKSDSSTVHGVNSHPVKDSNVFDEVFDFIPVSCKESYQSNVALEGHPQSLNCSDFSTPNPPSPVLDQMTIQELQETFRRTFGQDTLVMDKQWLKRRILFGLENCHKVEKNFNDLGFDTISDENDGRNMFFSNTESSGDGPMIKKKRLSHSISLEDGKVSEVGISFSNGRNKEGSLVHQKRLRKPPKRYSEALSLDYMSRSYPKKCKISYRITKEKSHKPTHLQKRLEAASTMLVCQDESFKGGCIQVPFGLPVDDDCLSIKEKPTLGIEDIPKGKLVLPKRKNDAEYFSAESDDENTEDEHVIKGNSGKGSSRRKHHISWTLSEVMKLIEGVSRYGVGRWTEIKKLQFCSSSHRTSVDLKDKWRNLLRASDTQLRNKRKVDLGRKQASHQVPDSVLRRVQELATIYPYPRETKSKLLCAGPTVSPFPTTTSNALVPLSTVV